MLSIYDNLLTASSFFPPRSIYTRPREGRLSIIKKGKPVFTDKTHKGKGQIPIDLHIDPRSQQGINVVKNHRLSRQMIQTSLPTSGRNSFQQIHTDPDQSTQGRKFEFKPELLFWSLPKVLIISYDHINCAFLLLSQSRRAENGIETEAKTN